MYFLVHKTDCPRIGQLMNGERLDYLDSTATSLKPGVVLEAMKNYYCHVSANVHRGVCAVAKPQIYLMRLESRWRV